jgi:hypothetical protein
MGALPAAAAPTPSPAILAPEVRVVRRSFFPGAMGGSLRWTESATSSESSSAPESTHSHGVDCGCTSEATERPAGQPTEVQVGVVFAWLDCLVRLDDADTSPWVTFRRAGDVDDWVARGWRGERGDDEGERDHAYFTFRRREDGCGVEIGSPGHGLTGVVFATLFQGDRVDVSHLRNGMWPTRAIDLREVAPDRPWVHHGGSSDRARVLRAEPSVAMAREAFRLARALRDRVAPVLTCRFVPVDVMRRTVAGDAALPQLARELRDVLAPTAYGVEHTELFQAVQEMEAELAKTLRRP